MSITVSTDVFCDGEDCSQWTHGGTGARPDAKHARQEARRFGWKITRAGDFCPACAGDQAQGRAESVYGTDSHG